MLRKGRTEDAFTSQTKSSRRIGFVSLFSVRTIWAKLGVRQCRSTTITLNRIRILQELLLVTTAFLERLGTTEETTRRTFVSRSISPHLSMAESLFCLTLSYVR